MSDTQLDLMVRAAWMYYEDGLTQQAIAERLHLSRVAVTRLLQRAREEGIVQIKILRPLPAYLELEGRLRREYGLRDAHVVKTQVTHSETLDEIGKAGARHLLSLLRPGIRLGFGWSATVSRMAPHLEPPPQKIPCIVNDLAGSMLGQVNPYSISAKVAEVLSVPVEPLPVPVVLQSAAARDALFQEPQVRAAMENARRCDVAFVGLGEVGTDGTMVRTGYLTPTQMVSLQGQGVVGEVLLRFFDHEGQHVPTALDARVVSLEWEDIRRIPHLVVMAAGPSKIPAIRGILRAGICHCLITDAETAETLLES